MKDDGLPIHEESQSATCSLDGGIVLTIRYEDGQATLSVTGGQVCFAPGWYLETLQA